MSKWATGDDWQACGIAQIGAVAGIGAATYFFQFRSQKADFSGAYLFVGGALGLGGDMGGGAGPSPADVATNTRPDLWTSLKCVRAFSADDLNWAYGALSTLAAGVAYGYALTGISGGLVDPLFTDQEVSGWGTGVGVIGAILAGVWKRLGDGTSYS
jgi:hypothetical protein